MHRLAILHFAAGVLLLSGCATQDAPLADGLHRQAKDSFRQAASRKIAVEQRAALYVDAAFAASRLLDTPDPEAAAEARRVYNEAVADLTIMLRTAGGDRFWNRTLHLSSGDSTYSLRFSQGTREGAWDPDDFTSFTAADEVKLKTIKRGNRQEGVGGALVGVRKSTPPEAFSPAVGITAPVTAVLDFNGRIATLTLVDPTKKTRSRVAGKDRWLEADFSAPLAYYPQKSELWEGLMGAIRVSDYMKTTGLYQVEPYDPDRIPLIFVHGLISTPRMWRNVINEIETDPVLRNRYQCLVFAYPTGNPPLYSAMRLREELTKFYQIHPAAHDCVLVGHSMGGILSRTQVTTVQREHWDVIGEQKAERFFARVRPGDLIHRTSLFNANPRVDRAVFICTPHRGSEMAVGTLGDLAIRLISLPVDLASTVTGTLGDSLAIVTGDPNRVPNSVIGLSPRNPTYQVLDRRPIEVPYHSIIGDRGKGDTPDSSDGVVKYWSSNLKSAKSETIVPGPHGACEMPETIAELRRILHLHLETKTQ